MYALQAAGDLWYFPAGSWPISYSFFVCNTDDSTALGQPHSIQAKNTTKDGAEFLLIFDSGEFSEDSTFLLTDWLAHVPKG